MQKDRDLSFDAFRGLAIIAVVAIHAIDSDFSWRYSPTGEWIPFFLVAYRQLLNFAVPAFIFMSGYWSSKKPIKSLQDYKTFLIRRLSRVLIPYFLWSFVLLGYQVIKTNDINVQQIIFKLLTGRASTVYFFVVVIAQLYIITPLLQYINSKRYGLILVLILNVIGLLSAYLSRLYFNYWIPVSSAFYSWIIFYEIGLLIGNRDNNISPPKNMRPFILPAILISLLISAMEAMILLSRYDAVYFAIAPVKYSSFLYSACIILGFLFVRERLSYWPRFLVTLGNYSFGIYLIHVLVIGKVVSVVQKNNVVYSFQPLYQFTVVLITISMCFVLISITRKLLPDSFCRKVLGF